MKIKNNFHIVIAISSLLLLLSLSISLFNYMISLRSTESDLRTRSLPLTVDNIYTEIQKHVIEPNLVASMMAHDTFLTDWLVSDEKNQERITRYLETIKNKYGMFVTFLVSEKTQSYYTHNGFLEQLNPSNPNNQWYYQFKKLQGNNEINLDFNNHLDNALIMFINHKIYDQNYHFIGATGIGIQISYINDMLKRFRQDYNFTVMFVNEKGEIVLSEHADATLKNLSDITELNALMDQIIVKNSKTLEYQKNGDTYLLKTKYIPELNLYLLVEAKLDHFTQDVRQTFYLNLLLSLIATIMIMLILIRLITQYNNKLEFMARHDSLTGLPNRNNFSDTLRDMILLSRRESTPFCLIFFDIDNFKRINDTHGHQTGDAVLVRIGEILSLRLRRTDMIGRWGGEEFTVGLVNTDMYHAKLIAEALRQSFEEDAMLIQLCDSPVTASFGVVELLATDTLETLIHRADAAMYQAKERGKNRAESIQV